MTAMLVYLFFLHFVADFLLQSREMGKKKSSDVVYLMLHLVIQFAVISGGLGPFYGLDVGAKLALANALVHGVIDWNIWRLYKSGVFFRLKKNPNHPLKADSGEGWRYWEDHLFYSTIGFDQLLHVVTLTVLARYFL